MELHFFDPHAELEIYERRLPHWIQPGVLCFVTFRTADSMPKAVIEGWRKSRVDWLSRHGIDASAVDWRTLLSELTAVHQKEFYAKFSARWHQELDAGYGSCYLRNSQVSNLVKNSLLYANGQRYELTDFVIMPNHVHLLGAFQTDCDVLKQCESWKRWTATKINRMFGLSGRFWQQDGFDHLVRSEEQFLHFRRYIAQNPVKAKLRKGDYLHWSQEL